jgi:Sec61beta family.
MAKKKSGLRSGAGLIQYYEEEENRINIGPTIVIATCICFAVLVGLISISIQLKDPVTFLHYPPGKWSL